MTYEEALAYISSLAPRGWRLGLDRMEELVRRARLASVVGELGGPQFIHVAGTNGKGSVTAFLQSLLVEQGYRTGAFFSPYVYDPRERVQFGREMITREELAESTAALIPAAESLNETDFGGATEFEFKTALGFRYWAAKRCEWVALEVGLGGRLDATNVVTPRASVIVSIGLDHTSVLGSTEEEIAAEKAGIIKPGVPVVVGQLHHAALRVIEDIAYERRAPLWRFGLEIDLVERRHGFRVQTPLGSFDGLALSLPGVKQPHNMALAVAALHASGALQDSAKVPEGVRLAWLPGRFERKHVQGREVVLDGAHNEDAALVLAENLERYYPGRRILLVTGMVAGHDPKKFYTPLIPKIKAAYVAPIEFHRALSSAETRRAVADCGIAAEEFSSVKEAIRVALGSSEERDLILISGSFYLIGEAGPFLETLTEGEIA